MRDLPCSWERCDQPGLVTLLIGHDADERVPDGWYCLPHAAIAMDRRRQDGYRVRVAAQPRPVQTRER